MTSTDRAGRSADYSRIQDIYLEDLPSIAVHQAVQKQFFRNWVHGTFYSPMQNTPFDLLRLISKG